MTRGSPNIQPCTTDQSDGAYRGGIDPPQRLTFACGTSQTLLFRHVLSRRLSLSHIASLTPLTSNHWGLIARTAAETWRVDEGIRDGAYMPSHWFGSLKLILRGSLHIGVGPTVTINGSLDG